LGLAVIGISPDQPAKQKKFDDKYGLAFPLLADPDHRVAEAYGAWGEKTLYGKKTMGIIRSSFLIDGAGKIVQAWYGVKPEDTVPKAQAALEGKAQS
jgi:peroxiredoxin Q/BCP